MIVVSVLIFLTPTFLGSGPLGTQCTVLESVIKSQALIFQFWGKSTLLQHKYQYEIWRLTLLPKMTHISLLVWPLLLKLVSYFFSLLLWRLSFDHPIEHSASKYLDGFDIGEWLSGLDNDSSRHGICFGLISLLELQGKVELVCAVFGLCSIWVMEYLDCANIKSFKILIM